MGQVDDASRADLFVGSAPRVVKEFFSANLLLDFKQKEGQLAGAFDRLDDQEEILWVQRRQEVGIVFHDHAIVEFRSWGRRDLVSNRESGVCFQITLPRQ